jgi:hypothetical protein
MLVLFLAVFLGLILCGQPHWGRQSNDQDQTGGKYETIPEFHDVLLVLHFGGSSNTLQNKNAADVGSSRLSSESAR